jgi:hypothetical protein
VREREREREREKNWWAVLRARESGSRERKRESEREELVGRALPTAVRKWCLISWGTAAAREAQGRRD